MKPCNFKITIYKEKQSNHKYKIEAFNNKKKSINVDCNNIEQKKIRKVKKNTMIKGRN